MRTRLIWILPLVLTLSACTLPSCATVKAPTPETDATRLLQLDTGVSHALTAVKVARTAQQLEIALKDQITLEQHVVIQKGFRVFFIAADAGLAAAAETARPFEDRRDQLDAVGRALRELIVVIDIPQLKDARSALQDESARFLPD